MLINLRSSIIFTRNRLILSPLRNIMSGREQELLNNYREISARIQKAKPSQQHQVDLVAVSKTKPLDDILSLHRASGHLQFGENYVQELIEKSKNCPAHSPIKWHFIGTLQSNKCKQIVKEVPNLDFVETLDSIKKANLLNSACLDTGRQPLNVLVQVNTSLESTKSGVSNEDECISLAKYVLESCPGLRFRGFMTIGDPKNSQLGTSNDNPDFIKLIKLKNRAIDELSALISSAPTDRPKLELSMGMSSDFEQAICMGSSMVRVGSSIFGARNYNKSNK